MQNMFATAEKIPSRPRAGFGSFVLLLTRTDEALSVDRQILRQALRQNPQSAGASALPALKANFPRLRTLGPGRPVLELLARRRGLNPKPGSSTETLNELPGLIICTEKLADMDALTFLRAATAVAGSQLPPVLVIADAAGSGALSGNSSAQARFLALGASAVLERPYSLNALENVLARLLPESSASALPENPETAAQTRQIPEEWRALASGAPLFAGRAQAQAGQGSGATTARPAPAPVKAVTPEGPKPAQAPASSPAPNPAPSPDPSPDPSLADSPARVPHILLTRKGLEALRAGSLDLAEDFLRRALDYDSLDLEACEALAALAAKRSNPEAQRRWLNRCAVICLHSGQNDRAEIFLARMRGLESDAENARPRPSDPLLAEALALLEEENYPAACDILLDYSAQRPEAQLHQIMARVCQFSAAPEACLVGLCASLELRGQALTARSIRHRLLADVEYRYNNDGFLGRFPLLQEAWAVARFTMRAWRRAA